MPELISWEKRQFCRGASPSDHSLINSRRGRNKRGQRRRQRVTPNRLEELVAGEGLEIGLGEISRHRSWHPGNNRSGHLKPGRNRGRWDLVNLLFRGRGRTSGSRPWHSQTTDRDSGRRCLSLWFSGISLFPLEERWKASGGLLQSSHVLETQPSSDFVQRRGSPAALEFKSGTVLFRGHSGFGESKIHLFGPWV